MSVREIARSHAGGENLTGVTDFLLESIRRAQAERQKVIFFVTGIPGAGKTLAGLNLVHNRETHGDGRSAPVFMSGNGPLIKVLQEALARDFAKRTKANLGIARARVKTFVQNVHSFVQFHLDDPPDNTAYENAIIFDEAQRAWSADKNRKEYKDKPIWHIAEPEMLLKIMDRHRDWACVVALVGGGQEIHEGEAGLSEWGMTLVKYPHWRVVASKEALEGGTGLDGSSLFVGLSPQNEIVEQSALHLKICLRSHQATHLADWVNCVLRGDEGEAIKLSAGFDQFPIVLCREISQARKWLSKHTRGERRCGFIASSGAARLRAYGLEPSISFRRAYPYFRWFLDSREDVRSSFQLEVVATEFEIQGLELDIAGLCWGGDFVWDSRSHRWQCLQFTGKKWRAVEGNKKVQIHNKYRVLLTRAREGLVIYVPHGDVTDATRNVGAMNDTAEYLVRCGAVQLK
jgi:hypothetical protein